MREFQIGDRVTGRCTTMGTRYTGRVAEVRRPAGQIGPVYKLVDTGAFYAGGAPIEPMVEVAGRAPGADVVDYFDLNTQDYYRSHGIHPDVTVRGAWVLVHASTRETVTMTGTLGEIAETLEGERGAGVWNVQP